MNRGYGTGNGYDGRYGGGYGSYRGGSTYKNGGYKGKKSFLQRMLRRNRAFLFWFPVMLVYEEFVYRIFGGGVGAGLAGFFFTLCFSLAVGCFLTFLSTLFLNKINVYIVIALTAII